MKKIMFGVIGLLSLVLVLLLVSPSFTAKQKNLHPQVEAPVVIEPSLENVQEYIEYQMPEEEEPEIIELLEPQEDEQFVEEPVEEPIVEEPVVEEPVVEPVVEQPVEEPVVQEPVLDIEDNIEEKVVEPEEEFEERIVELPEFALEEEEASGELFFEEFVEPVKEEEPVKTEVTTVAVEYKYIEKEKEFSNKGFFFQGGMSLGGGIHNYHGNTSIMYSSGFELKAGAFFTENIGAYAFAKPDVFAEIKNVSTFIALPNSLNLTGGAGLMFEFGKFGVEAQAGYSILQVSFANDKTYAFASFSVIPEYTFVQSGKTKVKITLPLSLDQSQMGYDAFGGIGLSVKFGGKEK